MEVTTRSEGRRPPWMVRTSPLRSQLSIGGGTLRGGQPLHYQPTPRVPCDDLFIRRPRTHDPRDRFGHVFENNKESGTPIKARAGHSKPLKFRSVLYRRTHPDYLWPFGDSSRGVTLLYDAAALTVS